LAASVAHAQFSVLWWDSTPEYGSQALDAYRQEMSDYVDAYGGGSIFNSTYVSSEVPGTLAAHLASNSYDVIVFDATSSGPKFNASDLAAAQAHYAGKSNLILDGTLYIRSISYDAGSNFPGINGGTGGLTVNEVNAIATRGGGIMIGTDHSGYQTDANQILNSLIPAASFSGITYPSTDGEFYGSTLLNSIEPIAAVDVFNHWDSIDTQAIAPTGGFVDYLGNPVTLSSLVSVADEPGGGTKLSYISASFAPGSGSTDVDDDTPGGNDDPSVPEPSVVGLLGFFFIATSLFLRRRR